MTAPSTAHMGFLFSLREANAPSAYQGVSQSSLAYGLEYVYLGAAAPCFIISLHESGGASSLFSDAHDAQLCARLNSGKDNTHDTYYPGQKASPLSSSLAHHRIHQQLHSQPECAAIQGEQGCRR